MPSGAVFFLSDAHLGAESEESEAPRERRLHDFLSSLPGRADSLVIVGDLFDFWFEYRTAIPRRHFATLSELHRLRAAGVPVTYLAGNHDFWLGHFLRDELGIHTMDGPLELEAQGRRLWIHHGDGLIGGDLGYRILRKVVRHPASIRAYSWLHPDLGIPLAKTVSGMSRKSRGERPLDGDRIWREVAMPRFAQGFDGVVIGHLHRVYQHREGDRELLVLGDWIDHFTYAALEGGRLSIEHWPES